WHSVGDILANGPRPACGCWGGGLVDGDNFHGVYLSGPRFSPTNDQPGDIWMREGCDSQPATAY
ncbi:MAG: hypothetical protein JSV79_04405, partial [Armatimonadota bacterium]